MAEKTGKKCTVCKNGEIVRERKQELKKGVSLSEVPIGPGSKKYYEISESLYCEKCGVKYRHLPHD